MRETENRSNLMDVSSSPSCSQLPGVPFIWTVLLAVVLLKPVCTLQDTSVRRYVEIGDGGLESYLIR